MSNVLVFIHIIAYNISVSKMLNDIINEEVQNRWICVSIHVMLSRYRASWMPSRIKRPVHLPCPESIRLMTD